MKRGPRRRRLAGLMGAAVLIAFGWASALTHPDTPAQRPCGDDQACLR
jgi:hypothetical protein